MSSPTLTPNDLTRQQLDELDELLQRMLNLPLAEPPTAIPRPSAVPPTPSIPNLPAGWRADPKAAAPKAPYLAAEPVVEDEPFEQTMEAAVPVAASAATSPFAVGSPHRVGLPPTIRPYDLPIAGGEGFSPAIAPVPTGPLRGVDAPALPLGFQPPRPEPEPEPIALVPAAPEPSISAKPTAQSAVPLHHLPLYAVNWVLETGLGLCGPLGTLTAQPAVKHALGATGVLLLVGAGVWAARGMGWIEWAQ